MASSIPEEDEIEVVSDATEEGPKWIRKKVRVNSHRQGKLVYLV